MKKTVRALLITLAALLVVAAIPFAAVADPVPADNTESLNLLMDVPNLATTITEGTYTLTASGTVSNATTLNGNEVNSTSGGNNWHGYAGVTNIGLTADTHYVITYTAQYDELIDIPGFTFLKFTSTKTNIRDSSVSILFDQRARNSFNHLYAKPNWINYEAASCVKYEEAGIEASEFYSDNDFVIAIDGVIVTVYMNHERLGQFSIADRMNVSPKLALGTSIHPKAAATAGQNLAVIKDIKVYEGTYELYKTVTFEGGVSGNRTCTVGQAVGELPAVDVAEDEVAVWCLKDTDTVVDASYVVKSATTLDARVFKKSASEVYGIQLTAANENKLGVRFVSVLQSLEGSQAGFEVIAKYQNGEGPVVTTDPFELSTNYVYSSITADADGLVTTVSATDMGGSYIMALAVDDVPADLRVDFLVRSYVIYGGAKVYSDTAVFKLNNGAVDSELAALS